MEISHSDDNRGRSTALKIKRISQKEVDSGRYKLDNKSGSENEDIDFSKEIHPLGFYINDREKMIEEMFSIIKGEKLKRMLPPLLKNYTMEELKADCLVHLLGMSKKRIFGILEGHDLNSSSDSESEKSSIGIDSNEEPQITNSTHLKFDSEEGDTLDISISKNDLEILSADKSRCQSTKRKQRHCKEQKSNKSKKLDHKESVLNSIVISDDDVDTSIKKKQDKLILKSKKNVEIKKEQINKKKIKKLKKRKTKSNQSDDELKNEVNDDDTSDHSSTDKGKSLLEILELEMRARAIRAMLKNTPNTDETMPVSILNMKPESAVKVEKSVNINKAIAEVINDKVNEKVQNVSDVVYNDEISEICNFDLTVIIDDDDDNDEGATIKASSSKSVNEDSLKNAGIDSMKTTNISEIKTEKKVQGTPKISVRSTDNRKNSPLECSTNIVKISAAVNETSASGSKSDKEAGKAAVEATKNVSWSQRWIESKSVKDVMKNSKLCANIRKRMRSVRMLKEKKQSENNTENNKTIINFNDVEESSVAQYNLIKSFDKLKKIHEQSSTASQKLNYSMSEIGDTKTNVSVGGGNNDVITDGIAKTENEQTNSSVCTEDTILEMDSVDILEVSDISEE